MAGLGIFLCVAILTLAGSQADALIYGGIRANLVTVIGKVFCSANGNPCSNGCPPLVGARVDILNNGRVIDSVTTQTDGSYTIDITTVGGVLNGILIPSQLKARVPLPIPTCPVLATATGALEGTPQLKSVANDASVILLEVPTYNRVPA